MDITGIRSTGASSARVDVVVVAEGYTEAERAKFLTDANAFGNYLLSTGNLRLNDPFGTYGALVNLSAVFVASAQSGYSTSSTTVNTAFGARAYGSDGRLVYGDNNKVNTALASLAGNARDIVIVLINSSLYGGAGGSVAWATAGNPSSYEIALHEIGHSFAQLQDEYVDPALGGGALPGTLTSVHLSLTSDPATVPWQEWLGYTDGLGTVGVYEGGLYRATGVWRATAQSKMLSLNTAFSAPQKEAFINRFYAVTAGLVTLVPQRFLTGVEAATPDNSLFSFTWKVNSLAAGGNATSLDLRSAIRGAADGNVTLNLAVTTADATGMVRRSAVLTQSQETASNNLTFTKTTLDTGRTVFSATVAANHFVAGSALADSITLAGASGTLAWVEAGDGNDSIVAGAGNDSLNGGGGNDRINAGDGDNSITGDAGDDSIQAGAGSDTLVGGDGSDTLDGGGGADRLDGGAGNDSFVVESMSDLTFEAAGDGIDTVISSGSVYLYANLENLILAAAGSAFFGVGNELANVITGNAADNLLLGGAGNDSLGAGGGNDAVFGETGADSIAGAAGIDYLVGGDGNDSIDGGDDADALYGEAGDDFLIGGATFHTDILAGGDGNDTLGGASGQGDYDLLNGAGGNDVYFVDTPADLTFEGAGEGDDSVIADIRGAGYYLYPHVENLTLAGVTPFGVGNDLANRLTGSDADNWLLGGAGNDTLDGAGGLDVLFGEAGADRFVFRRGGGDDVIGDFAVGVDKLQLLGLGITSFSQLLGNAVQVAGDTGFDLGQGETVILLGVTLAQLTAADFLFG